MGDLLRKGLLQLHYVLRTGALGLLLRVGLAGLVLQMVLELVVLSGLVPDHPEDLFLGLIFEPLFDSGFNHFSQLDLRFESEPTEPSGLHLRV